MKRGLHVGPPSYDDILNLTERKFYNSKMEYQDDEDRNTEKVLKRQRERERKIGDERVDLQVPNVDTMPVFVVGYSCTLKEMKIEGRDWLKNDQNER